MKLKAFVNISEEIRAITVSVQQWAETHATTMSDKWKHIPFLPSPWKPSTSLNTASIGSPSLQKAEKTAKGYRSVQHLGAGRLLNPSVAKALVVVAEASVLRA